MPHSPGAHGGDVSRTPAHAAANPYLHRSHGGGHSARWTWTPGRHGECLMNRRDWFLLAASSVATTGLAGTDQVMEAPAGARVPAMKFVYDCDATLLPAIPFGETAEGTRRIIPITGGTVKGPRIRGVVLNNGADWN